MTDNNDTTWNASTDRLWADHHAALNSPEFKNMGVPKRRRCRPLWPWILLLILLVLGSIAAVLAVLATKNIIHFGSKSPSKNPQSNNLTSSSPGQSPPGVLPAQPSAECSKPSDIPSSARGTWTDQTSWLDMTDFNCTFTDENVAGLPLVGLFSTWDDSARANSKVPALNEPWGSYAQKPFRGVSLGGWLSLEPFITPSLFDPNPEYVDEYTLCQKLGPKDALAALEKHYSTFVTEDDFKSIAAAGLDHVRIPYSYWAVKTYENDPYVFGVSWRYLLRGIEWARKYGLRVKLDLHAVPGSQNGWNHSGKQGKVDWLSGPDGAANAQRTLDIHDMLSKFFAQDRYKNVLAFYGQVNEPNMTLSQDDLIAWTEKAYDLIRKNGLGAVQVFSESMRGMAAWKGKLQGHGGSLALDAHEYTLFDEGVIGLKHADRVKFACTNYLTTGEASVNTATGFGPTMVGEWSQADTDCTKHLNGYNNGARWLGTYANTAPQCPTADSQCSCDMANVDVSQYTSDYKNFLLIWAQAQMDAFEKTWGWFYWTWKTESAPQWSYKTALENNFMPKLAYERNWDCSAAIPSFGSLPEYY